MNKIRTGLRAALLAAAVCEALFARDGLRRKARAAPKPPAARRP